MSDKISDIYRGKKILLHGIFDNVTFDHLKNKKITEVFVMEGRPYLTPGRKSSRALIKRGITPIIISDNMAGFLFYKNMIKEAWVACEIVNSYGALCNIGALILGILGKKHKRKVHLFLNDKKLKLLGNHKDVKCFKGKRIVSDDVRGYVPLAEWVPRQYFDNIYY